MESTDTGGGIGTVILAAGANTRLAGSVPAFLKPLILVNGKPLVLHAVEHALLAWDVDDRSVFIVASPSNVGLITQVIPSMGPHFIVQPEPLGVVDALYRAVPFVKNEWTLILCADNTFRWDPSWGPARRNTAMIGARRLDIKSARRFTRFVTQNIDVSRMGDNERSFLNTGVRLIEASSSEDSEYVWIGPLLLRTAKIIEALDQSPKTIVELIKLATNDGAELTPLFMQCEDLGIPEELVDRRAGADRREDSVR